MYYSQVCGSQSRRNGSWQLCLTKARSVISLQVVTSSILGFVQGLAWSVCEKKQSARKEAKKS